MKRPSPRRYPYRPIKRPISIRIAPSLTRLQLEVAGDKIIEAMRRIADEHKA